MVQQASAEEQTDDLLALPSGLHLNSGSFLDDDLLDNLIEESHPIKKTRDSVNKLLLSGSQQNDQKMQSPVRRESPTLKPARAVYRMEIKPAPTLPAQIIQDDEVVQVMPENDQEDVAILVEEETGEVI